MKHNTSVKLCRLFFRLILLTLAIPVAYTGLVIVRSNENAAFFGVLLILAAAALPTSEIFFNFLKRQEKPEL